MGNRTITTVAGVHGQRMVPEYLINFLESIYPYKRPVNFGKRLLREDLLLRAMKLYKLAGKKPKAVFGRRIIPNYLAKFLEYNHFAEIDDTDMAYIKELNSIAYPYANVLKIGGMSWKINQLMQNGNFSSVSQWNNNSNTSYTVNDNVATIINTEGENNGIYQYVDVIDGHKYFFTAQLKTDENPNSNVGIYTNIGTSASEYSTNTNWENLSVIVTATSTGSKFVKITLRDWVNKNVYAKNAMLFDLTAMGIDTTDVATATSELLKRGIDINTYHAYNTGSTRDSAVTSVISKDSNNTTIDTLAINASIQALEGYGRGINDTYKNVLDFVDKTFTCLDTVLNLKNISKDDISAMQSGTEEYPYRYNVTSVIGNSIYTSGTIVENNTIIVNQSNEISLTFHGSQQYLIIYSKTKANKDDLYDYLQANDILIQFLLPSEQIIETDISSYITTNEIEIANGGNLTFTNTYEQAVPSEITYIVRF